MIDKYIAQLDAHEMALRIAESLMGITRPQGKSAEQCLADMKQEDASAVAGFYREPLAAFHYLEDALNDWRLYT